MKINKMNPEDARERMRPLYEAARAMSELAEGACGSELYGIVKKHLFDELDAATRAMMDSCNAYAESAEHARASVAGPDVRMDAVKGGAKLHDRSRTLCRSSHQADRLWPDRNF